jgi:hypothetical protein
MALGSERKVPWRVGSDQRVRNGGRIGLRTVDDEGRGKSDEHEVGAIQQ